MIDGWGHGDKKKVFGDVVAPNAPGNVEESVIDIAA
jgi:hypothetical protein